MLQSRACRWSLFVAAAIVLNGTGWTNLAGADENADIPAKVQAHLDAGEFGVARQMIGGINDPAMRDAMLMRMAQQAMRGGSRNGFGNAMGGMGNSAMRSGMLGQNPGSTVPAFGPPMGGGVIADFEPLMELIRSTTGMPKPGWVDDGGVGTVREFNGGVYVDNSGVLRKITTEGASGTLTALRKSALHVSANRDVRKHSEMRKVSLTRLERAIQLKRAMGQDIDETMHALAGMQRVKYVLVYPETGDLVLVGPAGDWSNDVEGRLVSVVGNRPVLQLDDLIVMLRKAQQPETRFGCSIDPRQENLAQAKAFLEESSKQPLKTGQREAWLNKLRDSMGKQDISVFGIDPRTRVARVLVEADYRMKLVGMGLEEGVLGVTNYLDSIQVAANENPPPMDVLRWWFTVNYDAIQATEAHNAYEIKGQGVKVLSENQMLTERGERIPTGRSAERNSEFVTSFTKHFPQLAQKYPIYAELQNIFDLALVAGLIQSHDLAGQVSWPQSYFNDPSLYRVAMGAAPKEVDTVVSHRIINRKHVLAGVSGGVSVDVRSLIQKDNIKVDTYGALKAAHQGSTPHKLPVDLWWWD